MKGMQGLILAIGLGIAGAMFNWAYLNSRSPDIATEAFVGIKPDATVERGDRLLEEHLEPVYVPRQAVGNLDQFAVLYADLKTVVGMNVWRTLPGGSLLLKDDLKTPPQNLNFGETVKQGVEERAVGIPVDTRTFVPALVNPGDFVSFVTSNGRIGVPTPAPTESDGDGDSELSPTPDPVSRPRSDDSLEIIGPFKVLSLGNRLGSAEVMRAARLPQVQENVMTILVRVENGKLEAPAARLLKMIESTGFRPVAIMLHPRQSTK